MYTTQTDLSADVSLDEVVSISLTTRQWDKITNYIHVTGSDREPVLTVVDRIRLECKLPPRPGIEYKINITNQ